MSDDDKFGTPEPSYVDALRREIARLTAERDAANERIGTLRALDIENEEIIRLSNLEHAITANHLVIAQGTINRIGAERSSYRAILEMAKELYFCEYWPKCECKQHKAIAEFYETLCEALESPQESEQRIGGHHGTWNGEI